MVTGTFWRQGFNRRNLKGEISGNVDSGTSGQSEIGGHKITYTKFLNPHYKYYQGEIKSAYNHGTVLSR